MAGKSNRAKIPYFFINTLVLIFSLKTAISFSSVFSAAVTSFSNAFIFSTMTRAAFSLASDKALARTSSPFLDHSSLMRCASLRAWSIWVSNARVCVSTCAVKPCKRWLSAATFASLSLMIFSIGLKKMRVKTR